MFSLWNQILEFHSFLLRYVTFSCLKKKEVVIFALFSMCIHTKALPLFSGHFLRYESSKEHCSHGFSSWKCSETHVSHYFLFIQEVAQKPEFWGYFLDMKALGYSSVVFFKAANEHQVQLPVTSCFDRK